MKLLGNRPHKTTPEYVQQQRDICRAYWHSVREQMQDAPPDWICPKCGEEKTTLHLRNVWLEDERGTGTLQMRSCPSCAAEWSRFEPPNRAELERLDDERLHAKIRGLPWP